MRQAIDLDTVVLHVLRAIGTVPAERVATAAGVARFDAESHLIDLAVAGWVKHGVGPWAGWAITDAGKAEDHRRMQAILDAPGARDALAEAFVDFETLNPRMLHTLSSWQQREMGGQRVLNDHTDHRWDDRVLSDLTSLHRKAVPVLDECARVLPWHERYRARLDAALAFAQAGHNEAVTDSLESYHAVWFQWHEDLLTAQGIDRFGDGPML